jgi:hypothetical protein
MAKFRLVCRLATLLGCSEAAASDTHRRPPVKLVGPDMGTAKQVRCSETGVSRENQFSARAYGLRCFRRSRTPVHPAAIRRERA